MPSDYLSEPKSWFTWSKCGCVQTSSKHPWVRRLISLSGEYMHVCDTHKPKTYEVAVGSKLKYQEIMWAEQKPDVYDGPECDQHRPRWYAYADGDKEGGFDSVLNMNPANFPAGTKVVVSVPCCPLCGVQVEICEMSNCEFDWKHWADGQYS